MLELLLRLRQTCNHPELVPASSFTSLSHLPPHDEKEKDSDDPSKRAVTGISPLPLLCYLSSSPSLSSPSLSLSTLLLLYSLSHSLLCFFFSLASLSPSLSNIPHVTFIYFLHLFPFVSFILTDFILFYSFYSFYSFYFTDLLKTGELDECCICMDKAIDPVATKVSSLLLYFFISFSSYTIYSLSILYLFTIYLYY